MTGTMLTEVVREGIATNRMDDGIAPEDVRDELRQFRGFGQGGCDIYHPTKFGGAVADFLPDPWSGEEQLYLEWRLDNPELAARLDAGTVTHDELLASIASYTADDDQDDRMMAGDVRIPLTHTPAPKLGSFRLS